MPEKVRVDCGKAKEIGNIIYAWSEDEDNESRPSEDDKKSPRSISQPWFIRVSFFEPSDGVHVHKKLETYNKRRQDYAKEHESAIAAEKFWRRSILKYPLGTPDLRKKFDYF